MSGDTPVWVGLAIVIVALVVVGRLVGQPISARRLLVLPLVALGLGLVELLNGAPAHVKALDLELLVLSALISVGLGAWRGLTIKVFVRNGDAWQRYTVTTVVLWGVQIAAKFAVAYSAERGGAILTSGTWSLLLTLGLSLAAEAGVLAPRALATHASLSPRGRSRLIDGLFGSPYPPGPQAPPDPTASTTPGGYPHTTPRAVDLRYPSRGDARRLRREQRRQDGHRR